MLQYVDLKCSDVDATLMAVLVTREGRFVFAAWNLGNYSTLSASSFRKSSISEEDP